MTHNDHGIQTGALRVARAFRAAIADVNRAQRTWFDDFVRLDNIAASGERVRH